KVPMLEIIVDTNSIKNIDFSATENVHRPPFRRLKMKENNTAMSTYKIVLIPYENEVIDRKLVKFFVTNSMTIPRTKDIKPSMTPYFALCFLSNCAFKPACVSKLAIIN